MNPEQMQKNGTAEYKENVVWLVYWDHYAQDAWLYGSTISFLPDGAVLFENGEMPPGFSVREWFSLMDYQEKRMEPQLPLLEEKKAYHILTRKMDEPENGSFLRLNFYDRQGELLDFCLLREEEGSFTYPEGAFSYSLQLVQGGAEKIRFRYLALMEEEVWEREKEALHAENSGERVALENAVRLRRRTLRL